MEIDLSELSKNWIIPILGIIISLIAIGLSLWFASSARKDAEKAQEALDNINKAINTWQDQVMKSTINIIDSSPQIIEEKQPWQRLKLLKT